MTFKEALKFIEDNGETYKENNVVFKRKIAPLNSFDLQNYINDVLAYKKVLSNEDAKQYTEEDKFVVYPFDISVLPNNF